MNDPTTINPTITDEIRSLCLVEKQLAAVDQHMSELKSLKRECEHRVIDAMTEQEVDKITVDGRAYRVDSAIRISPDQGMSDQVVAWVASHGGADLIQPAMHHAKRDAFLRETLIDDDGVIQIPEELVGFVTIFEEPVLKARRGA